MATPTPTEIAIFRGEDVTLSFTVDPVENVSGWTVAFTVARRESSAVLLIEKTLTIASAAAGTFTLALVAADTEDLDPGVYKWSARRTNSGSSRVYGRGDFVIDASVEPA